MLRKVFLKTSSVLYRAHSKVYRVLNQYLQEKKAENEFSPYILKNKPSIGKAKIIHVNGNFIVGGTTQLIVDIIENISDEYSHEIIVPEYPEPLPYQPVTIHKFTLNEMELLCDFLKKEQPAIIHIHYWVRQNSRHAPIAIWYATVFKICEDLGIKVIQNINVPTEPFKSSAVVHNVFVSKFVLHNFNKNSIEVPASVIYPGSNFGHFNNEHPESLPTNNIGMVYRLDQDKLNPEAIEVFIAVVKKQPSIKCYIVGGGYYLDYYKNRVVDEKLGQNFVFTGIVSYSSLPDYYKKINTFVTPVHDESFGQVTPFAMSMGLCVAGYDTGALSEILGSKDTLVEYGQVEQLAEVILSMVNNPTKRIALGRSNQERAHNNFSVESMIGHYRDLYSAIL